MNSGLIFIVADIFVATNNSNASDLISSIIKLIF